MPELPPGPGQHSVAIPQTLHTQHAPKLSLLPPSMGVILDSDFGAFQSLSVLNCSKLSCSSTPLSPSSSGPSPRAGLPASLSGSKPQVLSFIPPSMASRMVMLKQSTPPAPFPNAPTYLCTISARDSGLARVCSPSLPSQGSLFPCFLICPAPSCELTLFLPFLLWLL